MTSAGTIIDSIPHYVDRIYLLGRDIQQDFPSIRKVLENPRVEMVKEPPAKNWPEAGFRAAFAQALDERIDIVAIIPDTQPVKGSDLPSLLDPIIWGKADYTKGVSFKTPTPSSTTPSGKYYSPSMMVSQVKLATVSSEAMESSATTAAFSRLTLKLMQEHHVRETTKKVLVAIPCYNEALAIGSIVLKAQRYVDEVLVVDDGRFWSALHSCLRNWRK